MSAPTVSRAGLLPTMAIRLVGGIVVMAALVFLPAGTLAYWEAWVLLVILFGAVLVIGVWLYVRDPEALERRMRTREREKPQKGIIAAFIVLMVFLFVIPGLDHRYGWSNVPAAVALLAEAFIVLGFLLFFLTVRENRYASRVIEVEENQEVITTGPYAVVRHPMYLSMTLVIALWPLALGSWWGFLPSVLVPVLLAARIVNEERILAQDLPGYAEYLQKVRYRLLPFVW
ncbi:MAG TPA: isoprenylcysteine carboxylmethyltransferase family protein [Anaerolineales bacterium]|nr:isoprenylcysteine carboxylmethyltransferase family protein [Anaerolineales bacterium]